MSPGPLTSSTRGGLHFQHGGSRSYNYGHRTAPFYGTRQAPHSVGRLYGADRQHFAVHPDAHGGTHIAFEDSEGVTVGVDDEGTVSTTIDAQSVEEPENRVGR